MENAPLTLAYAHARNAAQETKSANPVAASEEHDLAAAEFAAVAASSTDKEAVRILRLLEAHHRQLGQILKDAHSRPAASAKAQGGASPEPATAASDVHAKSEQPPRLARTRRTPGRDLSSSIASNLASARGILSARPKRTLPVSPLVSNEHADAELINESPDPPPASVPQATPHASPRPSWAPPEAVTPRAAPAPSTLNSPFQQFYNRFENAISTLTAPLAFASLPLTQQAVPDAPNDAKPPGPERTRSPRKVSSKADASFSTAVDFSQLISNAALRAVQGSNGPYPTPHESFYLVQPSGGTMSYADVTAANYIDRQISRQHRRDWSTTAHDDFVDASSEMSPDAPQSPRARRVHLNQAEKFQGKTMEELALENAVLRRTLNDTTKRVVGFENAAQQSAAMLAQSVRSLNLSPVITPENSRGKTIPVTGLPGSDLANRMQQKRIEELEAALQKYDKRLNKREDENAKLKETLGKYREKWEGLKAGAKARRDPAGAADKTRRASSASTPTAGPASSPAKDTSHEAAGT